MSLDLSILYIVKNEAEFLEASLGSVIELSDNVIIADTGSTDSTRSIISTFMKSHSGVTSLEMEWTDDFAAARNELAKKAKREWALFVDGDEIVDAKAKKQLEKLLKKKPDSCFSIVQRNYTLDYQTDDIKKVTEELPLSLNIEDPLYYFDNRMERLYRPSSGVVYEGRIHESLIPSATRNHQSVEKTDIVFHHFGRLKKNHETKILYYLELAKTKCDEDPENPTCWMELLLTLSELQRHAEAFQIAHNVINKFSEEPAFLKTAFQVALRADQFEVAEHWIQHFLKIEPDDLYARSQLSSALLYQKKLQECVRVAKQVLKIEPSDFVCNFNLGVIFFETQDWKNASRYLNAAQSQRPNDEFIAKALKRIPSEN